MFVSLSYHHVNLVHSPFGFNAPSGHTNCREESDANEFFEPHVVQEGNK
jgi:hypothetical protein